MKVPLCRPDITKAERYAVGQVMASGWISQGEMVAQAEKRLAELTQRKYAICTSSGTMALMATIHYVCGRDARKDIGVPTLTFPGVYNAIELLGHKPVFIGANPISWQPSVADWKKQVRNCDAFLAAPCYGLLGDMVGLEQFARETGTPLIEDACESFCGSQDGRPAGNFGGASVVSFFANKIITAAEGGVILTNDEKAAKAMRVFINHGIEGKSYSRNVMGFNGRMNDIQAGLLCAQLDRLPEMLERRQNIMNTYFSAAAIGRWEFPLTRNGEISAPWLFAGKPANVHSVMAKAAELDVETRPVFPCGHRIQNFMGQITGSGADEAWSAAEKISRGGICLPLSSALTDDEVDRVVEVIKSA